MKDNWKALKKIWVDGTTGQKNGKISRETLTAIDQFIFGFEKELRLLIAFYEGKPWGECEYREHILQRLKELLG